ncbi:hypothetical protein DENSPDRAFT_853343 [Dentipellis sp. KUC8613]|nr:hypothetical protein DENSPDRAFT_853343 [Dentipellis sp. KUC8613]
MSANRTLELFEREISLYEPRIGALGDLQFLVPPEPHSKYVPLPQDKIGHANSGVHPLNANIRANQEFLDMEYRLCEILHELEKLNALEHRLGITSRLGTTRNRALRALYLLRLQKQRDWERQRLIKRGGIDTG